MSRARDTPFIAATWGPSREPKYPEIELSPLLCLLPRKPMTKTQPKRWGGEVWGLFWKWVLPPMPPDPDVAPPPAAFAAEFARAQKNF
jgi:hypothetical protein